MEDIYKEVYFDQYCKNCTYEKTATPAKIYGFAMIVKRKAKRIS
jgi:hypothetical protein